MPILKRLIFAGVFFLFTGVAMVPLVLAFENGAPGIAKWYGNKAAAVSLRFDDSTESHVNYVIPKLNQYGIKATFMINPGLERYRKNKDFWEKQVPRMGQQLGNHTMHHRGAKTPQEADYEIGEVSRLIWKLYPNQSKLLVFASGGGGVKWGGRDWETASIEYKKLVNQYFLIDLYDGRHPYLGANPKNGSDELIQSIEKAIRKHGHQVIVFHDVGKPDMIDYLRLIYRGYRLTFSREAFEKTLTFLHDKDSLLWTGPLCDVLKYERERDGASLSPVSTRENNVRLALKLDTDPELYDQSLTVIVPLKGKQRIKSIRQGDQPIDQFDVVGRSVQFSVRPVNSIIDIRFQ